MKIYINSLIKCQKTQNNKMLFCSKRIIECYFVINLQRNSCAIASFMPGYNFGL